MELLRLASAMDQIQQRAEACEEADGRHNFQNLMFFKLFMIKNLILQIYICKTAQYTQV